MLEAWFRKLLGITGEPREEEREDMKVIIGLGNPGMEYVGTRHNVGFETIDRLAAAYSIDVTQQKHKGAVGQGMIAGQKVLLVKPMTYMNNSGECVSAVVNFYKLSLEDVIVIYDDINLDVGQLRLRQRGSAGGHNGMKSIIAHLKSEEFMRIRIGVGMKREGQNLVNHVLGRFPKEQQELIAQGMDDAKEAAELILSDGITKAMNTYNGKKR